MSIEVSGENDNSLTPGEVAYLAGLIDGEGTIGIYRQGRTKTFQLTLVITNTSPALLAWLRPRIGGGVGWATRVKPWHRPAWQLVIRQDRAARIIALCQPLLVIKGAQADLGLRFIHDVTRSKKRRVSDDELLLRRRYFDAMSDLNHEIHEPASTYHADARAAA